MDKTYLMLLNNNCTSNKCEINDDIKKYCMENDNLLTEDICHNLYTRNVYDNSNEELSLLLKEKCKKYPMHIRCMCSNHQRNYNYDNNNLLGGYGLNCLFPVCSKNNINYDPSNSNSSLLPLDIYKLDNSCPKNICQNIIKNSNFVLYSADISIANNCNNENTTTTTNTATTTNTTTTPITQTTTPITQTTTESTINKFDLWILIVICCILFIIIIILVIIFIGRSYNNNNNQEEV